jgi:hypothetical protein
METRDPIPPESGLNGAGGVKSAFAGELAEIWKRVHFSLGATCKRHSTFHRTDH